MHVHRGGTGGPLGTLVPPEPKNWASAPEGGTPPLDVKKAVGGTGVLLQKIFFSKIRVFKLGVQSVLWKSPERSSRFRNRGQIWKINYPCQQLSMEKRIWKIGLQTKKTWDFWLALRTRTRTGQNGAP